MCILYVHENYYSPSYEKYYNTMVKKMQQNRFAKILHISFGSVSNYRYIAGMQSNIKSGKFMND